MCATTIEMDATVHGWTEAAALHFAYRTFDEDTKKWFITEVGPEATWANFKAKLAERSPKGRKKSPAAYYNKRREWNEEVAAFIQKKRSLMTEVRVPFEYEEFLEEIGESCNLADFSDYLFAANPEDFKTLLEVASRYRRKKSYSAQPKGQTDQTPWSETAAPENKTKERTYSGEKPPALSLLGTNKQRQGRRNQRLRGGIFPVRESRALQGQLPPKVDCTLTKRNSTFSTWDERRATYSRRK